MSSKPIAKSARRSRAQWATLVAACERSGLTPKAYCQQQRLHYATFRRWRSTLRVAEADSGARVSPSPALIELTPLPAQPRERVDSPSPGLVELSLGDHWVLRIHPPR